MTSVAKIESGLVTEWPVNLRASFPQTSWPVELTQDMLPAGYRLVTPTPRPAPVEGKRIAQGMPIVEGDDVVQTWDMVDLPFPKLSPRQVCIALVENGVNLSQVDTLIEAIEDDNARQLARIDWERARDFERSNPLFDLLGGALGWTPEFIDGLWWQYATR